MLHAGPTDVHEDATGQRDRVRTVDIHHGELERLRPCRVEPEERDPGAIGRDHGCHGQGVRIAHESRRRRAVRGRDVDATGALVGGRGLPVDEQAAVRRPRRGIDEGGVRVDDDRPTAVGIRDGQARVAEREHRRIGQERDPGPVPREQRQALDPGGRGDRSACRTVGRGDPDLAIVDIGDDARRREPVGRWEVTLAADHQDGQHGRQE